MLLKDEIEEYKQYLIVEKGLSKIRSMPISKI